ncbi:Sec-independent protein translocase subunit TatA [Cellulosimicrobium sp. PMB13]|uniref:Sec-independent protein translocase subunit TatA n=1 Tax=Cellulosimicrobium sp. PMB13 TaxID=3120158 RepID=UPI003F4C214D
MNILRHPATIVVLILLVVLLFGSRRLPDLARSVGQSLKIFKKEVKDLREDDDAQPESSPPTVDTTTTSTTVPRGTTNVTGSTASSTQDGTSPKV